MRWRVVALDFVETTGIPNRDVGAQPLADGFIRGTHCVFEQL
jgi:hypothetical protein